MRKIDQVAFIGAGALGVMFGWQMTKTLGKQHVYFIADEARAARYQAQGFLCNGEACDFRYETQGPSSADLLIFATKYTHLAAAIEQARPFVGPDTLILSLLNGIASERDLIQAFGQQHVLYCVAQAMDATKKDNIVVYKNMGEMVFGTLDGAGGEAVDAVKEILTRGGVANTVSADIYHSQWSKLMLNVGVNQTCAVYDCTYSGIQDKNGEPHRVMLDAMRETQAVAAKEGIQLTDKEIEEWMIIVNRLNPNGMPSMRQDTLAGRKTEKALFAGTVCALGREHGVPTPVNDRLLAGLDAIEKTF